MPRPETERPFHTASHVLLHTLNGADGSDASDQLFEMGQARRDSSAKAPRRIIEPRLADHVRREALKFVNELKRAV